MTDTFPSHSQNASKRIPEKALGRRILRDLSVLCSRAGQAGSVPARTFAAFLRSNLNNEEAACEVEDLVERLATERSNSEKTNVADPLINSSVSQSLVLLRSGAMLSDKSSCVRFTKASALAYVSLKLKVMTEESQDADKTQLVSGIQSVENLLVSVEAETIELQTMLQLQPAVSVSTPTSMHKNDSASILGMPYQHLEPQSSTGPLDLSFPAIQQRLLSLGKLRQKALNICNPSAHSDGHSSDKRPTQDSSDRPQQVLMSQVNEEVSRLAGAVSLELDRRMALIADATSLREMRESAMDMQYAATSTVSVRRQPLEPMLAAWNRMQQIVSVKDLLEAKRLIRAAQHEMHLPEFTLTFSEPTENLHTTMCSEDPAGMMEMSGAGADHGLSPAVLEHLSDTFAATLSCTSVAIFEAQLGDLFTPSDYRPPLTTAQIAENGPQGPPVDSLLRVSHEWPLRRVKLRTNYSGLFPLPDGNAYIDTPIEAQTRRHTHDTKVAAQTVILALASSLKDIVTWQIADNSVTAMLGLRPAPQRYEMLPVTTAATSPLETPTKQFAGRSAACTVLQACTAATMDNILNEVEARALGSIAPSRQAAAHDYISHVDAYFRSLLHDQNAMDTGVGRQSPRARSELSSASQNQSERNQLSHHQQMLQAHADQLRLIEERKTSEPDPNQEMQPLSSDVKNKNRKMRAEYQAWLAERQQILLGSWLPESLSKDVRLALERYSVPVLMCGAWVSQPSPKSCLVRELFLWLSRELELEQHSIETCPTCNLSICMHREGLSAFNHRKKSM